MMAEVSSKKTAPGRSSRVVVPHAPRWHQRLGASLIYFIGRLYTMTLRLHWDKNWGYAQNAPNGPAIFCLWHNRLILCLEVYGRHARLKNLDRKIAALISASKDGAFFSAIVQRFGVQPVRGSSSRRGPQALLELTSWAERGCDLAITPDGPRGPRYIVQEGVLSLAQLTGLPIIPFSFYAHWKIKLKSWDAFQIPLPFSRCELSLGKPIHVPRDATDAQRESLRRNVEQILKEISRD